MSRDHRKLKAFVIADQLAMTVYEVTRSFPREELFGLTSQMRRAAVSGASNIVEGCARLSQREYKQFLNTSLASIREVGYFITVAKRLNYLDTTQADALNAQYEEAARVTSGLLDSMR